MIISYDCGLCVVVFFNYSMLFYFVLVCLLTHLLVAGCSPYYTVLISVYTSHEASLTIRWPHCVWKALITMSCITYLCLFHKRAGQLLFSWYVSPDDSQQQHPPLRSKPYSPSHLEFPQGSELNLELSGCETLMQKCFHHSSSQQAQAPPSPNATTSSSHLTQIHSSAHSVPVSLPNSKQWMK